ncbi:DUF3467 domain-containing protein [Candidatus Collierbacteria bacterium]|nr:DUF3467 domain-containing protein [Candidatus Collierbacteria bacterium]
MSEDKKNSGSASPASGQLAINLDTTPILYTNNILITAGEDGVVFDFCQRVGNTPQARVVARIGMSPAHAKKFLMVLKDQLDNNSKTGQTGSRTVN